MIAAQTKESLIAFEARIRAHFAAGELPCLIHLSGGNETPLLKLFADVLPGDWVFSTHRNHYHALLSGVPEAQLEADILAGHSMFIFRRAQAAKPLTTEDTENTEKTGSCSASSALSAVKNVWDGAHFFTSAILAGACCIAAGVAWSLKHPSLPLRPGEARTWNRKPAEPFPPSRRYPGPHVYCFLGDGAEEQGHFYEAALFAEAHELPITFIIEDNDRQVDTPRRDRRGDDLNRAHRPLDHFTCVQRYHYTPTYPHGGAGLAPGSVRFSEAAIERLKIAH